MSPTPIAVIGLSARYAGGVQSPDDLWALLKAGTDPIRSFPEGRWDRGFLDADRAAKGRSYIFAGGYLDDIQGFDADFFGISAREAQQMDPQQRLLLELAWEAFEDAGLVPADMAGSATGVYVGLSSRDYADLLGEDQIDAYTNLGLSLSIASNRVSYIFDLKGPSITVDTACSSGMVALHQAMLALRRGECSQALVGAANLMASPASFIGFSKASMLSPAGRCTSFDANGAGYVRAEGGGFLLLKPLAAAERDGDRILGVILASGVNSDGRTMGIALPNPDAQAALLRQVYADAGIGPDEVYYLEAHGTGTAVGDPIECDAIARVLGGDRRGAEPLRIGSVKSNVGHLENGAAIAGLSKVLLALRHREIPANLHFNTPNPKIDFEGWKLDVVAHHHPLPQRERPLVAGINSFGFGGTNGHCVVQEYRPASRAPGAAEPAAPVHPWQEWLVLSAQSEPALRALAQRWLQLLRAPIAPPWPLLRANALHHRSHHAQRLVLTAGSAEQAAQRIEAWLAGDAAVPGGVAARAPAAALESGRLRTAWVYAGNGPQWWAMGRQLLAADTTFAAAVREVDVLFAAMAGWSLVDELHREEADSRMARTEVAQPTLFALQVGLTTVLRAAGLQADAVIGHSVGEAAAAWASGALTLAQATRVIHQRSLAQSATAGMGRMAALGVSADEARAAIARVGGFLEIAAVNAPAAVTVAGDPEALERLCAQLAEAGRFARLLALDYPFHTRAMDGIRDGLLQGLDGLAPSAAERPFVSTVEGRAIPGEQLDATYWWRNIREPVAFDAGVGHLLQDLGVAGFIEIGPHPVLRDYLLQAAKARDVPAQVLTTLRRPREGQALDEAALMQQAVGQAYACGLGDPRALAPRPAVRVPLPLYPWNRQRHWRGHPLLPGQHRPVGREHPLLGWRMSQVEPSWEHVLDRSRLPYLADHVIQDTPVFPAAGYIEMALSAGRQTLGDGPLQLEGFDILKPLALPAGPWPRLHTRVDSDGSCDITSRSHDENTVHARMRITRAEAGHRPEAIDPAAHRANFGPAATAAQHYGITTGRGMHYGPAFQGVRELALAKAGTPAAWAHIELPAALGDANAALAGHPCHPVLMDACLQVLVFLLARQDPQPLACIPVRVDRLRWFAPLPTRLCCEVTLLGDSPRGGQARFTLYDEQGACVAVLDDARFQKVDLRARTEAPHLADRWRPDPQAGLAVPAALAPQFDVSLALTGTAWHPEAGAALQALCGAIAAQALRSLHAQSGLPADAPFTAGSLQRRARVAASRRALYGALLDMARSGGWLLDGDAGLAWSAQVPEVATRWAALLGAHPALVAELMRLAPLADELPALLVADDDAAPADVHAAAFADALADTAPWSADRHALLASALGQLLAQRQPGRALRLLQLNAGSGGATAALLRVLPGAGADFCASDPDSGAAEQLARQFAGHPALRTQVLDLAGDTARATGSPWVDVAIAGDGLLAAGQPPAEALRRVAALVAPGGCLLLAAPAPGPVATLLFGHQPTWWQGHAPALPDAAGWRHAFAAAGGWAEPLCLEAGAGLVMVARRLADVWPAMSTAAPAVAKGWLLLADASGPGADFAAAVSLALAAQGQAVRRLVLNPQDDAPELARRITAAAQAEDTVLHLAGLAQRDDDPLVIQAARCLPLLALAHSQQGVDGAPPLALKALLVSHGAQPGPAGGAGFDPAQAAAWGLARVLSNEHPGLGLRLVDLHGALDEAAAQRLAAEVLAASDETEVLLAEDGRWLHRVEGAVALPLHAAADQAVRLMNGPGGLDGLALQAAVRRAPGVGEVEIAVRAAGLNFRDVLWAMNMLPEEAVSDGFSGATIGMECAGEVVAVGEGVQGLAVGDRVIGFASGCFASHVTTRAEALAPMPAGFSFEEAATLPTTFLTAWYALVQLARLEPGERVLIHGAAGGVGLAALQIAKARGAVVFATAGNDDKRRLVQRCGADHVLDSRTLAFADDVMALTHGQGVDVVLNSLAGEAITKNLQILRPFGRLLEIGKRDLYANTRIGLRPFRINLSYFAIDADTLLVERPALGRRLFLEVLEELRAGRLRPLPFQALPITRAASAFRLMQRSRHVGKIVITLPLDAARLPVQPPAWRLGDEGTWLVTGGLGGFGLATAKWLAARGVRSLALVSRRGDSTDEARAGIAALQAAGATVRAFAADVSQANALEQVLASVRAEMAPLVGVLHAAMVLDDAPVHALDRDRLMRVLTPKLHGAWHLHRMTQGDALQHFVLFSSATVLFGNPGQGNYVAANQYLQAFAQWRRGQGLPALSIAWGAIRDVGVVTRTEGLETLLQKRSGIAALDAADALEELGRALASGEVTASVSAMDLSRASILATVRAPRLAALRPASDASGDAAGQTLAERWPGLAADARRPLLLDTLRGHLARILGSTPSQIDVERPLADLGMDSLMAVELAGSLERELGRPVSVMQMIQAASTNAVVDLLAATLEAPAHG